MIGGPNDVVIESEIIRAESREPRDLREARLRDKELREREPRDAPPAPAGISWPPPAEAPTPNTPQRKMPFTPAAGLEWETRFPAAVPVEESPRDSAPPIVLPTRRPPVFPVSPGRMPPSVPPIGRGPSNQREPLHGGAAPPQKPELATAPGKGFPRPPVGTPYLRSQALRQGQATAANPAPSKTREAPAADALAQNSHAGIEEIPTFPGGEVARQVECSPAPATQAGSAAPPVAASRLVLEGSGTGPAQNGALTLEEEMARLLGRAPS
jgi:flagellar protein FliO/FliZ